MTNQNESTGAWVEAQRAALGQLLEARMAPPADGDPGRLIESMRYSLLAPGKRIRPLLALAAAEAVGTIDDNVRLAAASVELVHCYSLIHDDLPAMDDDDFRRGRPSNHKAFDESTAILAGDALLTLAFDWIAEAGERARQPERYLRAVRALAHGAGARGMVRGQSRDLGATPPASLEELETLHDEKTAALFRAALQVGALAAGASPELVTAFGRYGTAYGIAFQHADDRDDAEHGAFAAAARQRLEALVAEACAIAAPLRAAGAPAAAVDRLVGLAQALLRTS
ncbi:MAG TPA: polyprenyl synthetase family protein [Polyangia bacterium]|nr:polyprenyl synthetase family protein [Polyangia bacterium]